MISTQKKDLKLAMWLTLACAAVAGVAWAILHSAGR
jgi:predicted component of type VI protein secretion system